MSRSTEIRRARPLLGTIVEIVAAGPHEAVLHEAVARAFAVVEKVQRLMSFHDPASDVSRLNDAPAGESIRVHAWTHTVVRRAQRLAVETRGVFDITVGSRLVSLGFLPRSGRASSAGERACFRDLEVLPHSMLRARRPLQIDLGGIAKGFAVDRAVAALRAAGATGGLVNAGGDLRAFGPRAWPVGIRHPQRPGEMAATIELREASLATSAAYFSRRKSRGGWISPLLDGVSREPLAELNSVSVLARTCLAADALTKVVSARPDTSTALLARHRARAIFLRGDGAPAHRHARAA